MRTIHLKTKHDLSEMLLGEFATEAHYDILLQETSEVYKPDGSILLKFIKGALSAQACSLGWSALRNKNLIVFAKDNNRGVASGKKYFPETVTSIDGMKYYRRKNGSLTKTHHSLAKPKSGIIGYFGREIRIPYCRLTVACGS